MKSHGYLNNANLRSELPLCREKISLMNKAKSCSGALVGANCKCIFAGELFEDPQRRTGYLGSMDYQTTRGETTLEVNRSGTCLTRGQEGQQVAPKHKSKSQSSCL